MDVQPIRSYPLPRNTNISCPGSTSRQSALAVVRSRAWTPHSRTLTVGPESAGADPGPACYGKGGLTATVTDADVVLGRINPDNFLGGRMRLDRARAIAAVQRVADPLKLSLMEAASGIARIAEFKMADIIRKMTVEKGFDPRDFVLFAFGGAGPAHAGVFAHELGVQKVVIPQKEIASTWCAFGAASADILHVYEQVDIQPSPFDAARINDTLEALERKANEQMDRDGIAKPRRRFRFSLDMRHRGQINEVEVMLAGKRLQSGLRKPAPTLLHALRTALRTGSSYAEARIGDRDAAPARHRGTRHPKAPHAKKRGAAPSTRAALGKRNIYWAELKQAVPSPIYDGALLVPGNRCEGPRSSRPPTPRSSCTRGARLRSTHSAISRSGSRHEHAQGEPDERRRLRRQEHGLRAA